jgi:DNA mismatch endonuclease (patch repair protein)
VDVHTPSRRSANMRAIRARDTTPELLTRKTLHAMGYRFRLHRHDLPGRPDIVLPRFRSVVFVHGCLCHRHRCRDGRSTPTSNAEFWQLKFDRNVNRDRRQRQLLRRKGWRVLVIWECQTRDMCGMQKLIRQFLHGRAPVRLNRQA